MADNMSVRDATGTTQAVRTTDLGSSVHLPHHRIADGLTVTGASESAANTDLLTGITNGWYDAGLFFSGSVMIIASAGISAGAIIFEQTNDAGNTAGVLLSAYEVSSPNASANLSAITVAASTRRLFVFPVSARYVRVRVSTGFTGGTVQAIARFDQKPFVYPAQAAAPTGIFWNESTTNLAGSATFTGPSRAVGYSEGQYQPFAFFRAYALANQAGTVRLESSINGSTWRRTTLDTAVVANEQEYLSCAVLAPFHRVVYVNGASAQTQFTLNSGYTAS